MDKIQHAVKPDIFKYAKMLFSMCSCTKSWHTSNLVNRVLIHALNTRVHSNNTVEMLVIVEVCSFLGFHYLVTPDAYSYVFFDSKHAANICLSTILARTHVQLGLPYKQLLLKVQHGLRFTMHHVHAENLANECADHAAALGALGLWNHNLFTRWGASLERFCFML